MRLTRVGTVANVQIIAWTDVHVVLWSRQIIKGTNSWSVHSTVLASDPVTTVDYKEGTFRTLSLAYDRDSCPWDIYWNRALAIKS